MPRISAPTVREHVARQERAILDAAADLFATRGVADTDLADIARAVGLARSSLYRYFPDKDHILAAWLWRETQPLEAEVVRIERDELPPIARIDAWLDAVLTWVGRSGGDLLPKLLAQVGAVTADVQQAISAGEARLREPLRRMVAEAVGEAPPAGADEPDESPTTADPVLAADLLLGAVDAGIEAVGRGASPDDVRDALGTMARAVLVPAAARTAAA
jgi:AcrR family transcriptional regulator